MTCIKCGKAIPVGSQFCLHCGASQTTLSKPPKKGKSKTRGNGTGTAYKRGKTWTVVISMGMKRDPTTGKLMPNRPSKGGFSTKKEALDYIPILREEAQGYKSKKEVSTLRILWEGYSESKMLKLSNSKQTAYKIAMKKMAAIQDSPIGNLTISDLQQVVDEQAPTYYPARDIKNLLSHLYKRAVAQQDVTTNLAEFIELPELEEAEQRHFTSEELRLLWEDYLQGNKTTGYILLMVYSGMMPGELFKAEKSMIDWANQQIVGAGLKTKKRKETPLVIADIILPVLDDLCSLSKTDKLINMGRDAFYEEFHKILARCGIEDRTPYACRHSTATALAEANVDNKIIMEVMRHGKFDTTKRYIHKDVDTGPMLDALNTIYT